MKRRFREWQRTRDSKTIRRAGEVGHRKQKCCSDSQGTWTPSAVGLRGVGRGEEENDL